MTETNDQTMVQQIKPRPIYSDMPHHIKKNIIKFADPFKNEQLRRTSKDFKALCDASPTDFIFIRVRMEEVAGIMGVVQILCMRPGDGTKMMNFYDSPSSVARGVAHYQTGLSRHYKLQGHYHQAAAEFLHKITKFRNHAFRRLEIYFAPSNRNAFEEAKRHFLQRFFTLSEMLQHKFHVNGIHLENHRSHEDAARLVALCAPRTLKTIMISGHEIDRIPAHEARITSLEQWRLAKEVDTKDIDMSAGFDHFDHFEVSEISMEVLTADTLRNLINIFRNNSAVRSTHIHFQREATAEEMKALDEYYETINSCMCARLPNSIVKWTVSDLSMKMRRFARPRRV